MKNIVIAHLKWLWLAVIIIAFDQATKYWAEFILGWDGLVPILPFFDFSLVHNTGAAFGFLGGMGGWQHVFFVSLASIISIVLAVSMVMLKPLERHLAIAYSLIIAGAIGNAFDRVLYQYVIDFIHFYYQSYHFPHFNIADISIFIGAMLLIVEAFGKPFLNRKVV